MSGYQMIDGEEVWWLFGLAVLCVLSGWLAEHLTCKQEVMGLNHTMGALFISSFYYNTIVGPSSCTFFSGMKVIISVTYSFIII